MLNRSPAEQTVARVSLAEFLELREGVVVPALPVVQQQQRNPRVGLVVTSIRRGTLDHPEAAFVSSADPADCSVVPDEADEMRDGLSEPVRAAAGEAVVLVESLVGRLFRGEAVGPRGGATIPEKETGPCPE